MGADQNTAILEAIKLVDANRRDDNINIMRQIEALTNVCHKTEISVAIQQEETKQISEKLDSHISESKKEKPTEDTSFWQKIKKNWQLIAFLILLGRASVQFDPQISNTLGINEPEPKSTTIDSTKIKQHNSINEKLIKGLIGAAIDDTNIKIKYN